MAEQLSGFGSTLPSLAALPRCSPFHHHHPDRSVLSILASQQLSVDHLEMQPGSQPGSRGPAPPGPLVSSNRAASTLHAMPSLLSPPPHQHHQPALQFEQAEHPAPPAMDEFLDQMFSLPAWNDMGGGGNAGRAPWDFNAVGAAAATRLGVDAQKLFTMSLLPPGLMGSHTRDLQDGPDNAHVGDSVLYGNDDNLLGTRMRGLQDNSSPAPGTFNLLPIVAMMDR